MRATGIGDAAIVGEVVKDHPGKIFVFKEVQPLIPSTRIMKMKIKSVSIKKETELNFQKLMEMVQANDSLALLMFGSPDPDAIASAMALREILQQTKGLAKSVFVSTEPMIRQQNIGFVSSMHLHIHLLNQVDLNLYRLIAFLDAQPSFLGDKLNFIKPHIVLDHHPREGQWQAQLEDVRPNYGALSSVLTEYLLCARVKLLVIYTRPCFMESKQIPITLIAILSLRISELILIIRNTPICGSYVALSLIRHRRVF